MGAIELKEALYTKCPLRFDQDGKFRILMVSDIHGGIGYEKEKTVRAMQALVDEAKPQLVILGGDIAGPGTIHVENEDQLRSLLDDISSPMEKAGIPWAHVYGNHDNNFGLSNERQQVVYESYPHCVSKAGPEEIAGVGNYVLPVWDNGGEKILFNVFGLDSHRGMAQFKEQFGIPEDTKFFHMNPVTSSNSACIHFDQIMWYWQTSELLENYAGNKIPALMFMHIPLPEHGIVAMKRSDCQFKGSQLDDVECAPLNSGLFAACLQRGDVKGIFCGHVHENDYMGQYGGIKLGFDGYMSYHACHIDKLRGGRVFEISAEEPQNFTTDMLRVNELVSRRPHLNLFKGN